MITFSGLFWFFQLSYNLSQPRLSRMGAPVGLKILIGGGFDVLIFFLSDNLYDKLAFWAEWLASLRHLSLKATNFAKPIIISDRKLNSKKIGSVWISFRFNHFLAI